MNDIRMREELEGISSVASAESCVLHLIWRLNQVAKLQETEEAVKREIYAIKRRAIHYFDLRGCIASRQPEGNGVSYVVIEAHGERVGMHLNTRRALNDARRREYMVREAEELSGQVQQWFEDRMELLFALKTIAKSLNFSKPLF